METNLENGDGIGEAGRMAVEMELSTGEMELGMVMGRTRFELYILRLYSG